MGEGVVVVGVGVGVVFSLASPARASGKRVELLPSFSDKYQRRNSIGSIRSIDPPFLTCTLFPLQSPSIPFNPSQSLWIPVRFPAPEGSAQVARNQGEGESFLLKQRQHVTSLDATSPFFALFFCGTATKSSHRVRLPESPPANRN